MTNLGNKDVFAKNLKKLVQKIKYKKNRKDPHLSAGALSVVVL